MWTPNPEFLSRVQNGPGECKTYPSKNTNIKGITIRPHVYYHMVMAHENGGIARKPGRLQKTCSTPKCIVHYKEIRKAHPDDIYHDYWGSTTDYAQEYGVSPGRVSQLRREADDV